MKNNPKNIIVHLANVSIIINLFRLALLNFVEGPMLAYNVDGVALAGLRDLAVSLAVNLFTTAKVQKVISITKVDGRYSVPGLAPNRLLRAVAAVEQTDQPPA